METDTNTTIYTTIISGGITPLVNWPISGFDNARRINFDHDRYEFEVVTTNPKDKDRRIFKPSGIDWEFAEEYVGKIDESPHDTYVSLWMRPRRELKDLKFDNDYRHYIYHHGVENVRFIIPVKRLQQILMIAFTTSDQPETAAVCKIVEGFNRTVLDNYKYQLQPIAHENASETFYVSDLVSLMRELPDQFMMVDHFKAGDKVVISETRHAVHEVFKVVDITDLTGRKHHQDVFLKEIPDCVFSGDSLIRAYK